MKESPHGVEGWEKGHSVLRCIIENSARIHIRDAYLWSKDNCYTAMCCSLKDSSTGYCKFHGPTQPANCTSLFCRQIPIRGTGQRVVSFALLSMLLSPASIPFSRVHGNGKTLRDRSVLASLSSVNTLLEDGLKSARFICARSFPICQHPLHVDPIKSNARHQHVQPQLQA